MNGQFEIHTIFLLLVADALSIYTKIWNWFILTELLLLVVYVEFEASNDDNYVEKSRCQKHNYIIWSWTAWREIILLQI